MDQMSTSNEGDYCESDYLTGSINNQSHLKKTRNNERIISAITTNTNIHHRPRTAISRNGGGNNSVRRFNNGTVISSKDNAG